MVSPINRTCPQSGIQHETSVADSPTRPPGSVFPDCIPGLLRDLKIGFHLNPLQIRIWNGIANGGGGGNSKTWLTYGGPDLGTRKYGNAYSIALVDHMLLNLTPKYSLNGDAVYTKSRGGSELHYANRKDGDRPSAAMAKLWIHGRPHLRLIYSLSRYNDFASANLYSPYFAEIDHKKWGQYIGIKAEWWLF